MYEDIDLWLMIFENLGDFVINGIVILLEIGFVELCFQPIFLLRILMECLQDF